MAEPSSPPKEVNSFGASKNLNKNYKVIFVIPAKAGIGSGNHSRSESIFFFNKVLALKLEVPIPAFAGMTKNFVFCFDFFIAAA
jgi:hypothetical protein